MYDYFSWERFFDALPKILPYVSVTFEMLIGAEIIGLILGVVIAIVRLRKIPVLRQLFAVYVSFMRGTPVIVQMLVVLYGLPSLLALVGIDINRMDKLYFVIIALGLNEAAFLAEIFRSAIASIDRTQFEAAFSVGLTWFQAFRRIVAPQAIRVAIPPYGVNLMGLLQSTSVAYMLGVVDIMTKAQMIGNAIRHSLEAFLVVMLIYVTFSLIIRGVFAAIDRKVNYAR